VVGLNSRSLTVRKVLRMMMVISQLISLISRLYLIFTLNLKLIIIILIFIFVFQIEFVTV